MAELSGSEQDRAERIASAILAECITCMRAGAGLSGARGERLYALARELEEVGELGGQGATLTVGVAGAALVTSLVSMFDLDARVLADEMARSLIQRQYATKKP